MSDIEALRNWFRECPHLKKNKKFGVNYLSDKNDEYAIYATPSTIAYHENVLGEEIPNDIQVANYVFASKETYGADTAQNINSMDLFQKVVSWVEFQNQNRRFPKIESGTIRAIVPTLTAYPLETGANVARYQIQLKITYRRN